MQLPSPLLQLLSVCVCIPCILSATGYYNRANVEHIYKRQADNSDLCRTLGLERQCFGGLYQRYVTLLIECNHTEFAQALQSSCRSTSSGQICGLVDYDTIRTNVSSVCTSNTTCSSECRDIITTTRDSVGCCINLFDPVFPLFALCNVEPETEECDPGPITLTQIDVDPTCTSADIRIRFQSEVLCRSDVLDTITDEIFDACPVDRSFGFCAVDEMGRFCDLQTPMTSLFETASDNCINTSICDPLCVQTLNTITTCCFITEYNSTLPGQSIDWLSYEFWTQCGLESPGFCEVFISDGNTTNELVEPAVTNEPADIDNTSGAAVLRAHVIAAISTALYFIIFLQN